MNENEEDEISVTENKELLSSLETTAKSETVMTPTSNKEFVEESDFEISNVTEEVSALPTVLPELTEKPNTENFFLIIEELTTTTTR